MIELDLMIRLSAVRSDSLEHAPLHVICHATQNRLKLDFLEKTF